MTRPAIVAALLSLSSLLFGESALAQVSPASAQRVEEEVRQASADEVRALLAGDVRTLTLLWADDFVVTNPLNQLAHRQQVLAMMKSGVLAFRSYDRQIEYVHAYGDAILVAGAETVVWAGTMPLAGRVSPLRFTALWMHRGGRWQEVARHANVVVGPLAASRHREGMERISP
jgi:ketosteroid isomerase-like protein